MRNLFGLFHLQIASHPNIYVLDTPGVLASEVLDVEIGSKLALTGSNLLCMCVCMFASYLLPLCGAHFIMDQLWAKNHLNQLF